jgi:hypothetical protein
MSNQDANACSTGEYGSPAGALASSATKSFKEESGILCLCGRMNTAKVQSYTGYHLAPEYQWRLNFFVVVPKSEH